MTDKTPEPETPGGGRQTKPSKGEAAAQLPAGLPADPARPTDGTPKTPRGARTRDLVPAVYLAGFVILAGAITWLWQHPPVAPPPPSQEINELREAVRNLDVRLTQLERQPTRATPDLAPLAARIAALEARKAPPPVDLGPLEAAVASLEQRPAADLALAGRVDALAGRLDTLASRVETSEATLAHRQDAADGRLATLEKAAGQIAALADRSSRIARIQAAQAALDFGAGLETCRAHRRPWRATLLPRHRPKRACACPFRPRPAWPWRRADPRLTTSHSSTGPGHARRNWSPCGRVTTSSSATRQRGRLRTRAPPSMRETSPARLPRFMR